VKEKAMDVNTLTEMFKRAQFGKRWGFCTGALLLVSIGLVELEPLTMLKVTTAEWEEFLTHQTFVLGVLCFAISVLGGNETLYRRLSGGFRGGGLWLILACLLFFCAYALGNLPVQELIKLKPVRGGIVFGFAASGFVCLLGGLVLAAIPRRKEAKQTGGDS